MDDKQSLDKRLDTLMMTLEALLETNMRTYDAVMAVVTAITGSRAMMDDLRSQHAQGIMYFPPFCIADPDMHTVDASDVDDADQPDET